MIKLPIVIQTPSISWSVDQSDQAVVQHVSSQASSSNGQTYSSVSIFQRLPPPEAGEINGLGDWQD